MFTCRDAFFVFLLFLLRLLLLCSLLTEYRVQQKDTLLLLRGGIIYYLLLLKLLLFSNNLSVMPLLITLLTENQIGAAGATQLADALQRNSTLTTLHLEGKHDIIFVVVCHCLQCN